MNHTKGESLDIEILKEIDLILKFKDPDSIKASIILNRIKTILGIKNLDAIRDVYGALKELLLEHKNKLHPNKVDLFLIAKVEDALAKAEGKQ
jgi:vesicle coat complex subunit